MASASGGGAAQAGRSLTGGLPGTPATSVADAVRQAAASEAAATAAAAADGEVQRLVVTSRELRGQGVDLPPAGDSPGDFFLFEERLFDQTGTRGIGMDSVRCELSLRTFTCEATLVLNGRGKIRIAGTVFSERDNVFPVTGGTGEFLGVGGRLNVSELADGRTVLVFHLVR